MKKSLKADKIWKYKLANPTATNRQIAKACGAHVTYVTSLMGRTGTPKEILEAPKSPKRGDILDTAKGYVTKDRASDHGDMEDNFEMIADFWSTYLDRRIAAHDVGAMMALLKVARIRSNPKHPDNWVDGAGYMACGGEIAGKR
tara:strand:- start:47 stop:478 length:432 start_codon:yes stop_codon:yes gene_type:complete